MESNQTLDGILFSLDENNKRFNIVKEQFDNQKEIKKNAKCKLEEGKELTENLNKKNNELSNVHKQKISDLKKNISTKKKNYKEEYNRKISEIKKNYNENINHDLNKIEESNKSECDQLRQEIINKQAELNKNQQLLEECRKQYVQASSELKESNSEEKQVLSYKNKIKDKYDNVINEAFLKEFNSQNAPTAYDISENYSNLKDNELIKIADDMNKGKYIEYPSTDSSIDIIDVISSVGEGAAVVLKALWKVISFIYKPVMLFEKFLWKVIYAVVITYILAILIYDFYNYVLIGACILVGAFIAMLIIMFIINLFKFGNKKKLKLLNLQYYSVGYQFKMNYDEVINRIAKIELNNLKTSYPNEYNDFIEKYSSAFIKNKNEKEKELEKMTLTVQTLSDEFQKLSVENEKKINEITENLQNIKDEHNNKETNERDKKIDAIKANYDRKNTEADKELNECIQKLDKEYKDAVKHNKNICDNFKIKRKEYELEIDNSNREITRLWELFDEIVNENKKIRMSIDDDIDITPIGERQGNDSCSESLFLGFTKTNNAESAEFNSNIKSVYRKLFIKNQGKPIVIVFEGKDEEDKEISKYFYKSIDYAIAYMVSKKYYKSFKFEIIDNKGTLQIIKDSMNYCGDDTSIYDYLVDSDMLTIHNKDRAEKIFEKIRSNREAELGGDTIDKCNSTNKRSDNMVKYLFTIMKIYNENETDFNMKELNQNLNASMSLGIVPIILMSNKSFKKDFEFIKKALKQNCNSSYYKWNLSDRDLNNINSIYLEKCKV